MELLKFFDFRIGNERQKLSVSDYFINFNYVARLRVEFDCRLMSQLTVRLRNPVDCVPVCSACDLRISFFLPEFKFRNGFLQIKHCLR